MKYHSVLLKHEQLIVAHSVVGCVGFFLTKINSWIKEPNMVSSLWAHQCLDDPEGNNSAEIVEMANKSLATHLSTAKQPYSFRQLPRTETKLQCCGLGDLCHCNAGGASAAHSLQSRQGQCQFYKGSKQCDWPERCKGCGAKNWNYILCSGIWWV